MEWWGVTGGVASGKSRLLGLLRQRGYAVLQADQLAKRCMRQSVKVRALLRRMLPDVDPYARPFVLSAGDKKRLRAMLWQVRSSSAARDFLWQLHLEVRASSARHRERFARRGHRRAFYEVPLLFENGLEGCFDGIILLCVSRREQILRLKERGLTKQEALLLVKRQMPQAEKIERLHRFLGKKILV